MISQTNKEPYTVYSVEWAQCEEWGILHIFENAEDAAVWLESQLRYDQIYIHITPRKVLRALPGT